ncbi:MAG: acyl carrier protein [Bryobacteraceae bacterium]|jgi:acyl carrier protein
MEELMPRLQGIFQDVFDDPTLAIAPTTTASDVSGWDSLTNINLIFAIEREFKVKFALGEIQELNNVGEMVALIGKKQDRARQ